MTSLKSLQQLSGNHYGFGGDLRFGETGPGAGLRGADKICATIAEMSMPGSSVKEWRAFLSVNADENGPPVNAIDRIGEGPIAGCVSRTATGRGNPLRVVGCVVCQSPGEPPDSESGGGDRDWGERGGQQETAAIAPTG